MSSLHPHAIAAQSFVLIRAGLAERGKILPEPLSAVVERIIHTTADFEFADLVATSPAAVEAGVQALQSGCVVLTDVEMVRIGINRQRLERLDGTLHCLMNDPAVLPADAAGGLTRSAQAMRLAAERGLLAGSIVAIGNAPTALEELLRLVEAGVCPALIIGVPVGFVGAAESKAALAATTTVPWLITQGRKGGSTIAVATVNALLRLAVGVGNDEL
ncbi:precorrin-8X methylmutase [Candidatus Viridilinea mediisalina]|uniref:Precorrin-8X methylmutase n=1 Tax=Candidatus Viridilinea mediisalina TaxID=2024553 RepID=A0A2A6RE63_9CHLR|nr:precorrin-8X methylmutase [Candidatus Viridilinea mediisalina]PDW01019.1 precorrin-8X methylmutase [Candidatus Viridilinea mediisalina]